MRPLDWLWPLVPRINDTYKLALDPVDEVFEKFEIDSDLRVEHFFAQVLHESSSMTVLSENLGYSVERLMAVWPKRFPDRETALPFARNPEALANHVYGGRLGNHLPGDGWLYRGRGFLQITGRFNYQRAEGELGIDLVMKPHLVLMPEHCLSVAACMWKVLGGNVGADVDDVEKVSRRINGGNVGLEERKSWLRRVRFAARGVTT